MDEVANERRLVGEQVQIGAGPQSDLQRRRARAADVRDVAESEPQPTRENVAIVRSSGRRVSVQSSTVNTQCSQTKMANIKQTRSNYGLR